MNRRSVAIGILVVFLAAASGVTIGAFLSNSVEQSGDVPYNSPSGTNITLDGDVELNGTNLYPDADTVRFRTNKTNITFTSTGAVDAWIAASNLDDPQWTNLTRLDVTAADLTVTPEGKSAFTVGDDVDEVNVSDTLTPDDGTIDFVYDGDTGTSNVTLNGVAASTTFGAVDEDTQALLDVATSDAGGTVVFDDLTNSRHQVLLQTGNAAPTISDANPTGDLITPPTQLQVQVNDTDFPSDNVDVEFSLDGSVVGTNTVSSNGTTSVSISDPAGGTHAWSVDVADGYGNTVNQSFQFRVPVNLTVREETPPHEQITVPVSATFFEDVEDNPEIRNLTVSDGEFDLTGFPTGTEFAVSVSAPGYHNRTVLIESIYEQDTIFLIDRENSSQGDVVPDTVENRFIVSDRTGNFPDEETEIIIQAPVNQSLYDTGGWAWLAAAGDDLGADEAFVTDLIDEKRYRIVVRNEDGDTRILGAYTAETTGTINLNIGGVVVDPEEPDSVGINASYVNRTGQKAQVLVEYNDTADNTSQIHLRIHEFKNESNVLVANQSFTGTFGTFTFSETVPAGENDTNWVVDLEAVRSGNNIHFGQPVGPNVTALGGLPGYIVAILFTGTILGVGGLFSQLNGDVGGIVVASLGALFWFVGLAPGYLGGGVVALSLLTAALLFIRERQAGGL